MFKNVFILLCIALLSGCATAPKRADRQIIDEKIIERTPPERPRWTFEEQKPKDGKLLFVGMSGKFSMKRESRDDAFDDAIKNVVKYIGADVSIKVNKLISSSGLSSKIMDPTITSKSIEDHVSKGLISRVKAQEWYIEKYHVRYKNGSKNYYISYVLAGVPESEVERAIKERLDEKRKEVEAAKSNYPIARKALELFGDEGNASSFNIKLWTDKKEGEGYKDGENVVFRFQADKDCYVYIFHMDTGGDLRMLFPNYWSAANKIQSGKEYRIPDELMNFDFKVVPPYGSEVAIAVATLKPIKDIDLNFTKSEGFKTIGKIDSFEARALAMSINSIRNRALQTSVLNTYK